MQSDGYREQGLRCQLVAELAKKGIADQNVLAAIGKIPRHVFMDSAFIDFDADDLVRLGMSVIG